MLCFSWLSALFGHSGWYSSDIHSQPLSQELQGGNLTDEDKGYQAIELMPQRPAVAVKRNDSSRWQSYLDPIKRPSKLMYQQLQSVQSLPQSTNEWGKHGVFVTFFRRQGGRPSFACATVVMEVWRDGTRVAWRHVFVEQLFLIPEGKEALESWLGRELYEGEIKQVYKSILVEALPDWKFRGDESLNHLWGSISIQRSQGRMDGLINRKVPINT
ncbi:hypothetical protein TMatcc_009407 [Talaromyces marneffei ATCC 18224]